MINLAKFISLLYNDVPVHCLFSRKVPVDFNHLDNEFIYQLMEQYFREYSGTELKNLIDFLKDECTDNGNEYIQMRSAGYKTNQFDVYSILFYYTEKILTVQDNNICCRYSKFLQWKELTLKISEEILIAAFLADLDYRQGIRRSYFYWPTVIGHNNTELNMIIGKEKAECHFHLKGSAPAFSINWIRLMNELEPKDKKTLLSLNEKRRKIHHIVAIEYGEMDLYTQVILAALIRLYLYACIYDADVVLGKMITNGEQTKASDEQKRKTFLVKLINRIIENPAVGYEYERDIYTAINTQRYCYNLENRLFDYVLSHERVGTILGNNSKHTTEAISLLCGERCFMYQIFRAIRIDKGITEYQKKLFYAYLLIKENLRKEYQQENTRVGFENFMIYEQRKSLFATSEQLAKQAMYHSIVTSNIRYLEARICPWDTALDNKKQIENLDKWIDPDEKMRDRYGYIMHFVKMSDQSSDSLYRHYELRNTIHKQSKALIDLREKYPLIAERVYGIDACNQEIGCRPEVFADCFRWLGSHTACKYSVDGLSFIPQLRITYHVGEDFLDVADGLRAIDETIKFMGLQYGDRLGHALALGIDVEKWYAQKKRIILPMQDYLDNIVWIYHAMQEYHILDSDNVISFLRQEFSYYFQEIFLLNIKKEILDKILVNANDYYSKHNINHCHNGTALVFDIDNYIKSWQLRGDNPGYYCSGFFKEDAFPFEEKYKINLNYPELFQVRYVAEAAILNYYYQYDSKVREKGSKRIEKKLPASCIKVIKEIQKKMQFRIKKKGIFIETNPTSNYLIGTFEHYDEHPLMEFYNKDIEYNIDDIRNCAQLSVSINTDDQGIFSTNLENEFSLMALALEQKVDENGVHKYDKTSIYRWINNIRKFGLQQSFLAQYKNNCKKNDVYYEGDGFDRFY